MTEQNATIVHVYFNRAHEKLLMGRLAWQNRQLLFEYDTSFIKTGLQLSPFKLPLKSGVIVCEDRVFDGLFGVFNDSLPDGWGRLLLDRKLRKFNINPGDLSALDRLCYVGDHGMGALLYEPKIISSPPRSINNLDEIANETLQVQATDDDAFVEDLLVMSGASLGARPKIIMHKDGVAWLIKFRSLLDPKDVGPIEYAYHLMAKAAKLHVPTARLFPSQQGPGYFGAQRFDRVNGKRIHMHTMSGLLHIDHRTPTLDYNTIMKATLWLTKDMRECEKQFRAAVFNILTHNRDDHAKNFSFLMDEEGIWQVSPAYDLTFSAGPGGEHCSTIMGEGKNPTLSHFLKLAEATNIKQQTALQIIDEVALAAAQWSSFARESGVSTTSLNTIDTALKRIIKQMRKDS